MTLLNLFIQLPQSFQRAAKCLLGLLLVISLQIPAVLSQPPIHSPFISQGIGAPNTGNCIIGSVYTDVSTPTAPTMYVCSQSTYPQWSTTGSGGGSGTVSPSTVGLPAVYNGSTVVVGKDPTLGGLAVPPLTAVSLPTPSTPIPAAGWTGYHASGDSITFGFSIGCTSGNPQCYVQRLAAYTGTTAVNNGISGDQACDDVKHAFNNDTPVVGDTILYTDMIGLNDANYPGTNPPTSLGAYQEGANECALARMIYGGIPTANKTAAGSMTPATNWSTDTTYSQMTGMTTSTLNAVQTITINYTAPSGSVYSPHMYVWYRKFDTGGATTPGFFSVKLNSGTAVNVSSQTSVPMATSNGSTDSIGVIDLGVISGGSGTETVTVTQLSATSTTTSILGIGYPVVGATTPALWVGGVSRNQGDINSVQTSTYNKAREDQVASLRSVGFTNINFIRVRNYWLNNAADMIDGKHPSATLGSQEIANAFIGATAQPVISPVVTPTVLQNRVVTAAVFTAGCQISQTDESITFNSASAGTCYLPTSGQSTIGKKILLTNVQTGAVTIQTRGGQGGSAVGLILQQNQAVEVENSFANFWSATGSTALDSSVLTSCKQANLPYTVLDAPSDACLYSGSAGGVFTLPTTNTASREHIFINVGTANMTFTGGSGTGNSYILPPGNAVVMIARGTTSIQDVANATKSSGYKTCTSTTGGGYTLTATDECMLVTFAGSNVITLPTTFAAGKYVELTNASTTNVVTYTGASSGTANALVTLPGQSATLVTGASGAWYGSNKSPVLVTGSAIGGSALVAGACTAGTATVTAAPVGTPVSVSPTTYPGDGFYWDGYVSAAGTVTYKICAAVAGTPTSSTYTIAVN